MVTPTDSRLSRCVIALNEHLSWGSCSKEDLLWSAQAVLNLLVVGWEVDAEGEDAIWREGYEQCLLDVVEAIAQEWEVKLPEGEEHASDRA